MNNIKLHIVLTFILVIGAINWGLIGLYGFNLINYFFSSTLYIERGVYILIGLIGLYFAFNRNVFLPFLGETVLPSTLVKNIDVAQYDKEFILCNIPKNVEKVLYWAAESEKNSNLEKVKNYKEAYGKYTNVGTSTVVNGCAKVKISTPQEYKVPRYLFFGERVLPKHFHYRYVYKNGFISEVMTHNI